MCNDANSIRKEIIYMLWLNDGVGYTSRDITDELLESNNVL